jgi:hypothetical protein
MPVSAKFAPRVKTSACSSRMWVNSDEDDSSGSDDDGRGSNRGGVSLRKMPRVDLHELRQVVSHLQKVNKVMALSVDWTMKEHEDMLTRINSVQSKITSEKLNSQQSAPSDVYKVDTPKNLKDIVWGDTLQIMEKFAQLFFGHMSDGKQFFMLNALNVKPFITHSMSSHLLGSLSARPSCTCALWPRRTCPHVAFKRDSWRSTPKS